MEVMAMLKRFLVALALVAVSFSAANAVLVFKDGGKHDDMLFLYHRLKRDAPEEFARARDYRENRMSTELREQLFIKGGPILFGDNYSAVHSRFMNYKKPRIAWVRRLFGWAVPTAEDEQLVKEYDEFFRAPLHGAADILQKYPGLKEALLASFANQLPVAKLAEVCGVSDKVNRCMRDGDTVIYPGRSPSLIFAAHRDLRRFCGQDVACIIRFDISGSPDAVSFRENSVVGRDRIYKNLVTPTRLKAFEDYLDSLCLNRLPGRLLIVDTLGTGGAINSLLRLFRHYYCKRHKCRKLPDIVVLPVESPEALRMSWECAASQGVTIFWRVNQAATKMEFKLEADQRPSGLRDLEVDIIPLGMDSDVENICDDPMFQETAEPGQFYPACYWDSPPRGDCSNAPLWNTFYTDYVKPMFEQLFEEYFKK
jgi:hypothetical protein